LSFPPPIGVEGRLRRESILQTISTIWIRPRENGDRVGDDTK